MTKRLTAFSLATDLLERGLQSRLEDLHIILIQVCDSGLLESEALIERFARNLIAEGESLIGRVCKKYPYSQRYAHDLMEREAPDLTRQVEIFRQEQFWRSQENSSLIESEELIRDLFDFYRQVEVLLFQLDAENEDKNGLKRLPTPRFTPNRYEQLFAA